MSAAPFSDGGSGGATGTLVSATPPHSLNSVIAPVSVPPRKPRTSGRAASVGKETRGLRRADTLIARGQVDKAIAHLRKLIAEIPDSTRGHLRIASLLHEKRQSYEALDILRSVIHRSPDTASAREVLSEICLEVGRPDEAIEHSRALLRITPRSLFARDVLSAAYLQCGKLNESLRVIQEMIYLDPLDATHHFKKGVLLQQKGLISGATESFLRVLQMDPDSEAADESRAALEMLDSCQIRQIITLAVEDIPFRLRLRQNPEDAVAGKGYLLTANGLAALTQMHFDELPSSPPGWQQYYYH
jgi:tetratricopeptide (TPR) repeat protein